MYVLVIGLAQLPARLDDRAKVAVDNDESAPACSGLHVHLLKIDTNTPKDNEYISPAKRFTQQMSSIPDSATVMKLSRPRIGKLLAKVFGYLRFRAATRAPNSVADLSSDTARSCLVCTKAALHIASDVLTDGCDVSTRLPAFASRILTRAANAARSLTHGKHCALWS